MKLISCILLSLFLLLAGGTRGEDAFPKYPKPEKGKKNLRNYGRQNRDTISEILYGEPEKAETYFRDYLREHPKDLESEYGLVLALTAQGRTDEALELLKSSIDHGLPFSRYMAGPRNLFASIYETDTYKKLHGQLATPILQGPMVGATGSHFVSVWVRTDIEREMTLQVSKDSRFTRIAGEQAGRSSAADDYTAVIRVTGLEPSTTYFYRFLTDDAEVKPDAQQSFTTFPEKGGKFSIAFGGGAGYAPEHERMWDTLRGQVRTPGRETEMSPAGKIVRALTDRLLDLWDVPPDFFRGMADSNLEHPGMVARQSS